MDKLIIPDINQSIFSPLKEEALIKIKNEPLFKSFIEENNLSDEIIKNNASNFLRVLEDKKKCENCKGKCQKSPQKIQKELVYFKDKSKVDVAFNTCDYYKKINSIKRKFFKMDFPENYLEFDYSKELLNNDYFKARAKVIKYLNSLLKQENHKGLYLYGQNKIGKSFILALFCKKYLEKFDKSVAFCASDDLFLEMKDLFFNDKNAFSDFMLNLTNLDLLVIDGLGSEAKSDFSRDSFLCPLLEARFKHNKLTLFTSNFTIDEIVKMYSFSSASLPKVKQLSSLIKSMADEIELISTSFIF